MARIWSVMADCMACAAGTGAKGETVAAKIGDGQTKIEMSSARRTNTSFHQGDIKCHTVPVLVEKALNAVLLERFKSGFQIAVSGEAPLEG